jgi:hypothetical protein
MGAWSCRQCSHFEAVVDGGAAEEKEEKEGLTDEQRKEIYEVYGQAVGYCQAQLFEKAGTEALAYLKRRGFNEETIRTAGIGYHPAPKGYTVGLGSSLSHEQRLVAIRGGLMRNQGRPNKVLKNTVILPYMNGQVRMIRGRALSGASKAKYLAPSGVAYYAGGKPIFFLHDVLDELRAMNRMKVILTEGELKALAPYQAWQNNQLSMPGIGTPGIQYLPEPLLNALAGFTVYLIYDVEKRNDPFTLSPGERFTIKNGCKLTGLDIKEDILVAKGQMKKAKGDDAIKLEIKLAGLQAKLKLIKAREIKVRVVRLPCWLCQEKVDLDDFLLERGPAVLEHLLHKAMTFERWYRRHGGGGHYFQEGGIWKRGQEIANYQATIVEDIIKHDGERQKTAHLFALRGPSGFTRRVEVMGEDWAEGTSKGLGTLRKALAEGGSLDDGRGTYLAVKWLSLQGDIPRQRVIYTVPGWQLLANRWHYLMPDGAITAAGVVPELKCELNKRTDGNWYALAGEGDAQKGFEAFWRLLSGDVCPSALALVLAGHAALAIIHKFLDTDTRPLVWLYGESGKFKTALARIFLSLFGPRFTAVKSEGRPLTSWSSSMVGLELRMYTARDVLVVVDDYKAATTKPMTLSQTIHNYSESKGRTRGRQDLTLQDNFPARGIMLGTGESLPAGQSSSDSGVIARLMPWNVRDDIKPDELAEIQIDGVNGHLAAFWRGFVEYVARWLDRDERGLREELQQIVRYDATPSLRHFRVATGLRLNKAAFHVVSKWLLDAGYITDMEAIKLDMEYEDARIAWAERSNMAFDQERPADKFLRILSELLIAGECVLEGKPLPGYGSPVPSCPSCETTDKEIYFLIRQCDKLGGKSAWHCRDCATFTLAEENADLRPDGFPEKANANTIGFYHNGRKGVKAVVLYTEIAFTIVQRFLGQRGERFQYNASDIYDQLANAKALAKTTSEKGRKPWQTLVTNPVTKRRSRGPHIKPELLLGEPGKKQKPKSRIIEVPMIRQEEIPY